MTDPIGAIEESQRDLVQVPWLQDTQTRALNASLGAEKDRLVDLAADAVKMRWPTGPGMRSVEESVQVRRPAPTAVGDSVRLRHLGATRDLPRLGTMSDEAYDAYLERAWELHGLGGTAAGIVAALQAYGIPDVEVVEEWQAGAWPGWGGTFNSHRIRVILGPRFGTLGWWQMVLPFAFGSLLGINGATADQLRDVARIVRRIKCADTLALDVVFRFAHAGGSVDPVLTVEGFPFPFAFGAGSGSMALVRPVLDDDGFPLASADTLGVEYIRP